MKKSEFFYFFLKSILQLINEVETQNLFLCKITIDSDADFTKMLKISSIPHVLTYHANFWEKYFIPYFFNIKESHHMRDTLFWV